MKRLISAVAVCAILGLAAGCASAPPAADAFRSPSHAAPATGVTLLLLHTPSAEPGYHPGDKLVVPMLEAALRQRGYRVARIADADYAFAVAQRLRQMGDATAGLTRQQQAVAEFDALAAVAKVACQQTGSPLLLRTRLLTRSTELWQNRALWDGVKRPLLFAAAAPGAMLAWVDGTGPGISLELVAVDATGALMVKDYGGIALPYENVVEGKDMGVRLRDKPFANEAELREGLGLVLTALLGS